MASDNGWNIVNWTLRNKLQWNLNRHSYIFIQEYSFQNVVCEVRVSLSRPQCVNSLSIGSAYAWLIIISIVTADDLVPWSTRSAADTILIFPYITILHKYIYTQYLYLSINIFILYLQRTLNISDNDYGDHRLFHCISKLITCLRIKKA